MKKSILLVALTAAFSASSTFAGGSLFGGSESDTVSGAGAMYGGASIGQASDSTCNSVADQAGALLGNIDCPTPSGWKVFGGYKVAQNLAVEGSYVDFGEAESNFTIPGGIVGNAVANPASIKSTATGFGVSGVASAPVTEQINVFGKAGFTAWEKEGDLTVKNVTVGTTKKDVTTVSSTDGVDLSLGAGAEYKINDNWGVRGEVEHFNGLNANLYSAGATFSTF
ncbi:outer membrane beta-barrel protein [Thiothrix fructosivorans]|jgi:OOP family OmpA-OmpF porin|uniref:Outer membrane beta-barrel protein n=1 Tax=Thiothrix fructosivorans TaxID=111770 RepID=A0A8B0SGD7_9GAMM|nr:outer membrane beta-barrel protein [Thiothrix fructosivorans]MBO0613851.1 outer membrane beta-barrel protein [Thiothrix fructosivorans]QTX10221.1 outer membrane beta-barrel protein [Thiothrix fructosivorans]